MSEFDGRVGIDLAGSERLRAVVSPDHGAVPGARWVRQHRGMGCKIERAATGGGGRALIARTTPRAACWSLRAGETRVRAIPPVPLNPTLSRFIPPNPRRH